jgi:predicted secreted Zn-dependent protease
VNHRAFVSAGAAFCALFLVNSPASAKPNHTTKYVYYSISGSTPQSIYSTLVKRGPKVGGIKAYAATTAVSSQSGQMTQGPTCEMKDYKFNIDFTIKLPKLKNEQALKGNTKAEWKKFSSFLKQHEETHRSIWLACGAALESKVKAIRAKSCTELNAKTITLWEQMRQSCSKKQDAFDVAEQKKLLRHPFVKLVMSHGSKSAKALAVPD